MDVFTLSNIHADGSATFSAQHEIYNQVHITVPSGYFGVGGVPPRIVVKDFVVTGEYDASARARSAVGVKKTREQSAKFLIDEQTGSAYHKVGTHICQHALSSDHTFSTSCDYDAGLIEALHEADGIALFNRLCAAFGAWEVA